MEPQKKHYNTGGRTLLTGYLSATARTRPQSTEEIYHGLLLTGRAPGRSTVYRLITALCEEGLLRRTRDGEGDRLLYQYVGDGHACREHLHLQCLVCGRVTHLECGCSNEIAVQLREHHGFALNSGSTVLYGTCNDCQRKEETAQ